MTLLEKLKNPQIKEVTLGDLHVSETALRQGKVDHAEWPNFVESIRTSGIINKPTFTDPQPNIEGFPAKYDCVDGAQRTAAWTQVWSEHFQAKNKNTTLEEIQAFVAKQKITIQYIPKLTADEIRILQGLLNIQRFANTQRELAQMIKRQMIAGTYTIRELASIWKKSTTWVEKLLRLTKLDPRLDPFLDKAGSKRADLSATLACKLAELPGDDQVKLVSAGLLDDENRDATVDAAIVEYKQTRKVTAGQYTPPKPKFIGFPKLKAVMEAAITAGADSAFTEGLLTAVGQDSDTLKNHELEWRATQAEKKATSVGDELEKAKKAFEAAQKKAQLAGLPR